MLPVGIYISSGFRPSTFCDLFQEFKAALYHSNDIFLVISPLPSLLTSSRDILSRSWIHIVLYDVVSTFSTGPCNNDPHVTQIKPTTCLSAVSHGCALNQ